MKWESILLSDIADFSNGINFEKSAYSVGVKLISVSNFGNRFSPDYEELQEVSEDAVREADYLQDGDIVFVRSNGNKELVGRCMLINNPQFHVTYSGFCIRARIKDAEKFNPVFFTYYFKNKAFRKAMAGTAVGSNIQNLSQGRLSKHIANVPDIGTQNRIASVLSSYDTLIENNQKQIKLLEEAAQRLYKEWFVDLRFPGHETTPIVDGIPEGWKEGTIADICSRIGAGGTPSRSKGLYWNPAEIKWFKTGELLDCWLLDSGEKISEEGLAHSAAKLFPPNTVLMAIYASPTLGRLGILASEASCNQAALCLVAKDSVVSWQWLYQKLYELRDEFNAVAKGAGQQNISADVVKKWAIIIPGKECVEQYTSLTAPMFKRMRTLQAQNTKLCEARDRLLPKLMSGEIEV